MSLYLRYGGCALLMIGALLISRCYDGYLSRRVEEYRGLVSLLSHAECEISKFLAYGSALWRDFQHDGLERCGFLPALRESGSLYQALEAAGDKMSLSSSAREGLSAQFQRLGRGYVDKELSLIGEIKQGLSAELESESAEAEKNKRVARALLLGGALSLVVMVI